MSTILVVGSLHYDIVLDAPHLPRPDETVMGENVRFVCGGKGGNQAVAARRHGGDVAFAGAVGIDFFADALLENLETASVDTGGIARVPGLASGMSVAIVEQSGEYGAVVASGANRSINPGKIEAPAGTRYLLLQNEIPDAVNLAAARQAKDKGARVILNAAPMRPLPQTLLDNVDILIVNRIEAAELIGAPVESADQVTALLRDRRLSVETVIVTLGADGLVFRTGDAEPQAMKARRVEVISSHGAGDAFVGAFAARLAAGVTLENALAYASAAAALHVATSVNERLEIDPETVAGFLRKTG